MKKVCVVVASRANYGRIKSVLSAIQAHPDLQLQLIVSASALLYRFGQVVDVIEADGFEVSAKIYTIVEGENLTTMAKSVGLGVLELSTHFENLEPDIVLTVADRFETMATALAASYMNIRVAHTQGGELTGSIDESVRHAITKLSHYHFVATDLSRERVVRMGEDKDYVFNTGCPAIDAIASLNLGLPEGFFEANGGSGHVIDQTKPYVVVLQHPVTTEFGDGFSQINQTLNAIAALGTQVVWLWPNVDAGSDDISKGLRVFREKNPDVCVRFYRNFSVEDYARLINGSECIIGNSSSGIRESAFLGVPAVNIGTRQNARERAANVHDVGYDSAEILAAVRKQQLHGRYEPSYLYGDGESGERIAEKLVLIDPPIQKTLTY
ncbi:UDP-N-acetylglucosamine 2-epimerase [Aliamphritea ceti]|uniref:UDP-N-acetylglucosamine 2-epimerase n=1 Tax=Aliamphritea ceti TaxID=1524258 RepID=UPI0021C35708|nr:UDP-N-acetylglucosamine 2-epimerase [Aliamphritea ceti]